MAVIYRDYRPQKFNDILGQNHLKITLQNELATESLAHAYLFCGPRAVGKTSMARVLAQAVNCERRQTGGSEPCGECAACMSVRQGKALDVMEIDAASNTGVDNVRDNIIASARLTPSSLKMRVFIIDEVHMLSISAFNALLKIMEEPPRHVLFILCTTEAHKVPATIISRCQRFDFKRISPVEIVKKLKIIAQTEGVEVDLPVLESIAKQSGGHLRDAESLFGQILALGEKKIDLNKAALVLSPHYHQEALSLIAALSRQDAGAALLAVNQLADNGANFKNFLDELLLFLRKLMLQSLQPGLAEKLGLDLGESIELELNRIAKDLPLNIIVNYLKKFLALMRNQSTQLDQLSLEIVIAELCLDLQSSSIKNVSAKLSTGPSVQPESKSVETIDKQTINKGLVINLSAEEVMDKWPELLLKIKKHNHSLSFILQNCVPGNLDKGLLALSFKYKFHRDRINSPSIKAITENTLSELFASPVQIEALLDEKLELAENVSVESDLNYTSQIDTSSTDDLESKKDNKSADSNGVLGNLLANFGGEAL